MELVDIYCLSYNHPKRKSRMKEKFAALQYSNVHFYDGVGPDDPRMVEYTWLSSCMLGHMDMIAQFFKESEKEYAIFCEDDICIHDKLAEHLPTIISEATSRKIDIVLLGYLMNYHIPKDGTYGHFPMVDISETRKLYTYSDELWGTQMYLISKSYAKHLLEKYDLEYAIRWRENPHHLTCYAADWIITKKTQHRALVFPPLCIENGEVEHYDHYGQRVFHKASHDMHVNAHFV